MEIKSDGEFEMKKYFIINRSEEKLIELHKDNKAVIDDKEYFFSFEFLNDEFLILRINNQNHFLKFIIDDNNPDEILIESRAELFKVNCEDEMRMLIRKMGYNKSDEKHLKEIRSPMPGVIVKLNVCEGQNVMKGDVLFVLEAMKMENEIKAVKDCLVNKIFTNEKKSVEKGELLIELE